MSTHQQLIVQQHVVVAPMPPSPVKLQPDSASSSSRPSHRSLMVVACTLLAVLVLVVAIPAASESWSAVEVYPPRIEVYSPAQATRAAKAAVAKLQQIQGRQGLTTANPLALPKTKETDLSGERRR